MHSVLHFSIGMRTISQAHVGDIYTLLNCTFLTQVFSVRGMAALKQVCYAFLLPITSPSRLTYTNSLVTAQENQISQSTQGASQHLALPIVS